MSNEQAPYPHLLPEVRALANLSVEERVVYISTDRWLPYVRAHEVLDGFEDLLKKPRVNRPPNVMLLARSSNGKSHILNRFAELHPGIPNVNGPNIIAPVMLIDAPPSGQAKDLYTIILEMLNRPVPKGAGVAERERAAVDILGKVETKILMVDEINHLLAGSTPRQREFMFGLKHLSNQLKMSLVIAGTPESLQVLRLSDQLENRFKIEGLPIWTHLKDLRLLLANFEQVLPLREASSLSLKSTATLISSFGVETIGAISNLLNEAAILALQNGQEKITDEHLSKCAPLTRLQKTKMRAAL